MNYSQIYLNQYTDIAFWLGSTTGALIDPFLWIIMIVASLAKKHRTWAVIAAAILYSAASSAIFNAGHDPMSWLHFPTRIIAGLLIGFGAMAFNDWRDRRKAVAQPS